MGTEKIEKDARKWLSKDPFMHDFRQHRLEIELTQTFPPYAGLIGCLLQGEKEQKQQRIQPRPFYTELHHAGDDMHPNQHGAQGGKQQQDSRDDKQIVAGEKTAAMVDK